MQQYWILIGAVLILDLFTGCSKENVPKDCTLANLGFTVEASNSACGVAQGSIQVIPGSGSEIVRYKLNDEPFKNAGSFGSLRPGEYLITVENADGCSQSQKVVLRSGISFKASVQPIIAKSCAIPNCHDGSGNIDYRIFTNFNPADMKARTQSRNMPKEGSLTDAEIEAIACWVDDGALNN
jgi:hypothetical protein